MTAIERALTGAAHGSLRLMNGAAVRYISSRRYLWMAFSALAGALICWSAVMRWPAMIVPASALGLLAALLGSCLLMLALRPPVELHETHLMIGRRAIAWADIRRVDQTGWNAPLAVYLTVAGASGAEERLLLVHPGEPDSGTSLLRNLRRYACHALLDGIPYTQFWGEIDAPAKQLAPPRYPLMRPEDEEEIERMFQRLKTVGRLDRRTDSDPR
jgi:hypothetical protein